MADVKKKIENLEKQIQRLAAENMELVDRIANLEGQTEAYEWVIVQIHGVK